MSYDCSIDGCEFTTHSSLGMKSHSRKHKRQYRDLAGERHDDYEEVRVLLAGRVGPDGDLIRGGELSADPPGDQAELRDYTVEAFQPGTEC